MLFLLALLFMPQQVIKRYPQPDQKCLYQWISKPSTLENTCTTALVVDVAYKNGRGIHTILHKDETLELGKPPIKVFSCYLGQGEPSAAPDHRVHPGFKNDKYSCLTQELDTNYDSEGGGNTNGNHAGHLLKKDCAQEASESRIIHGSVRDTD